MDNVATVRRMYELINAQDIGGFSEHIADNFVEHEVTPGLEQTKDGVKKFFLMQISAFPDLHFAVEDIYGSGDKVVARVRYSGTNKGDFMGMGATGKKVDVQLIDMFQFDGAGHARDHWGAMDMMAMMQQLGLMPQGARA